MRYRVEAGLTAAHLLSQVPGLRRRVEEMLIGILETAEEIRRIHGVHFETAIETPMRITVANYVISYLLDLDRRTTKIVFVEVISKESGEGGVPKAG